MALTATVGREAELDSIQAFIDAVPRGPSALSISGPAGIGKTILWEAGGGGAPERGSPRACRAAASRPRRRCRSPRCRISSARCSTTIAPALAGPRRRALEVALLLADPGDATPDPLAIGLAVLDALRALSSAGPCILALDDIQWLDAASAAALQIALRRLDAEPVAVLATFRHAPGLSIPIDLDRSFDADQPHQGRRRAARPCGTPSSAARTSRARPDAARARAAALHDRRQSVLRARGRTRDGPVGDAADRGPASCRFPRR